MAERISGAPELARVDRAFYRVFQTADPDGAPFQHWIERRALLFGRDRRDGWLGSISAAAAEVGESRAFLTPEVDALARGTTFADLSHYDVALDRPDLPDDEPLFAYALYSPSGTWGLMTSYEGHSVIGGVEGFMRAWADRVRDPAAGAREFVAYWARMSGREGGAAPDWVEHLLVHVYGAREAARFLSPANGSGA